MGTFLSVFGVFFIVIVLVIVWAVVVYNGLIQGRNEVVNAFSQIDVQLRRRHDLIPNLVEVARQYMKHERSTLTDVITVRNSAVIAADASNAIKKSTNVDAVIGATGQMQTAEIALTGALGRMFAVAEQYPDLKADTNMRQLSEELASTDNMIDFARQAYNDVVFEYNVTREQFPSSIIAKQMKFAPVFPLSCIETEQQRSAPIVKF